MTERSVIQQIKALCRQGFSLTEAKRIVHASLSDEEQKKVERFWEELEAEAKNYRKEH